MLDRKTGFLNIHCRCSTLAFRSAFTEAYTLTLKTDSFCRAGTSLESGEYESSYVTRPLAHMQFNNSSVPTRYGD
ncbi:hypothetical protein CEXT_629111 [Caerostris extrusa]|uniref:Uncharacterized protein n=1 Tax=Caerostris extrusa TaxID=172846 RepID=A0AAV4W4C0_CAEEX|nr:hypothetical protein CEXT_629111 [Caerostris extrusa]